MSEPPAVNFSALESKRFGYRIYRGFINSLDVTSILPFLIAEEVDIAILRIPSIQLGACSSLNDSGIPYLVADTLVYYECDLANYQPKELRNKDLEFIVTKDEHTDLLKGLVKTIFKDYQSHYSSNPLLKKEDILEGYQEWAAGYITDIKSGRISWIIKKNDNATGFAACSYQNDQCEIVLNGVDPLESGKGIYSDLIKFTQHYFKEKELKTMKVSTQVHNNAVQKVWVREGFFMKESYNTIHINSLFNHSIYPKRVFKITGKQIPVYMDPLFVEKLITEVLPELKINNLKTTYTQIYLSNIEAEAECRIEFNFPSIETAGACYKVLVKIFNTENNICQIAYYNLRGGNK